MVHYGAFIPIHSADGEKLYFLPSLLEHGGPSDTWTYKCLESWKTTLCTTWLFLDAVPFDIMEHVISAIVKKVVPMIITSSSTDNFRTREVLCEKQGVYLKLGSETELEKESILEIFIHLAEKESPLCVASASMLIGRRRLIVSAKGPGGADGRMIWDGGYKMVIGIVEDVLSSYVGLKTEKEVVCPDCIASQKPVTQASVWKIDAVNDAAEREQEEIRCRNCHPVKVVLVSGQFKSVEEFPSHSNYNFKPLKSLSCKPISALLGGVVLVGLLDKKSGRITRAGSGFVVDSKRGLIITASHTLINMDNHTQDGSLSNPKFGEFFYGLEDAEVVIGVVPESNDSSTTAVYRYFAKILIADVRNVDACVLWITKKINKDLDIDGLQIMNGLMVEDVRFKPQGFLEREGMKKLNICCACEYEERVRIIGYNQGGEGLLEIGHHVNRTLDFSVGYVCKKFFCPKSNEDENDESIVRFRPREEIVVIQCPTIGGHSGGPCVNQEGDVVGILSRSDPAESQRCYVAPASEWMKLVKLAKGRVKFVREIHRSGT